MSDLKLCRNKSGWFLLLFCGWFLPVFAEEAKTLTFGESVKPPTLTANSTFQTEIALPLPASEPLWQVPQEPVRQNAPAADAPVSKESDAPPQEPRAVALPTDPVPASVTPSVLQSTPDQQKIQWKPLIAQSLTFLWIEHSFRFLTEQGTRDELRGPFFKDWFQSVRNTRGWRDGDPFLVNYIGHPMQGAVTGYMFVHNDPKYIREEMAWKKSYFKSRLRAMLFSTVYSTQFELGPLSEASLGNVGLHPSHTSPHPSAFVDLVITPTLGTMWMMGEDALDRFLVKRIENRVENRVVRLLLRGFLSPSHSFANVLRGKYPWHRDGRRL